MVICSVIRVSGQTNYKNSYFIIFSAILRPPVNEGQTGPPPFPNLKAEQKRNKGTDYNKRY